MCGIGLAWFRQGVDVTLMKQMMGITARRGRDAFGVAIIRKGEVESLFRYPGGYSEDKVGGRFEVGDIVVWNCRARPMTEKESTSHHVIQPIMGPNLVVSHNGVVANEEGTFDLDTEIFARRYLDSGRGAVGALKNTVGGSAYIMVDTLRDKIIAIRDFKPLAKAYVKGLGYFIMSDREGFREVLGDMDVAVWEDFYFSDLAPFTVHEIDIGSGLIKKYPFEPNYRSYLPVKTSKYALVMASGGIDSSVSAVIASRELNLSVTLVHFNLGQKSEQGERWAVEYLARFLHCDLEVIDLEWLGSLGASPLTEKSIPVPRGENRENLKSTICWTPARNLVMSSCLMAMAEAKGASKILNGWSLEEEGSYPDNSLDFFRSLNQVSEFGTLTRPKIVMLESNLMKPEIVKIGLHYGLDFSELWSCDEYHDYGECGVCGACTLKKLALEQASHVKSKVNELMERVNLEEV